MYHYAKANSSDVLVAREQRVGRKPLGGVLFAQNRPRVDLMWLPLIGVLTPHKLFRHAFLLDHGLRFPEGKRRLEDHAFVITAYFAADVISVLADYPCYFWVFSGDTANYSDGHGPGDVLPPRRRGARHRRGQHRAGTPQGRARRALVSSKSSGLHGAGRREDGSGPPRGPLPDHKRTREDSFRRLRPLSHAGASGFALLRAGDGERISALSEALRGITANPGGDEAALHLQLPGRANRANAVFTLGAAAALGISLQEALPLIDGLSSVSGRYEILKMAGRRLRLLLAKNPAGWHETLEMLEVSDGPVIVGVNARAADGRDTSWLWDVPFERLRGRQVLAVGDRRADLAVRLDHAGVDVSLVENLDADLARLPAHVTDLDCALTYTAFQDFRRRAHEH